MCNSQSEEKNEEMCFRKTYFHMLASLFYSYYKIQFIKNSIKSYGYKGECNLFCK